MDDLRDGSAHTPIPDCSFPTRLPSVAPPLDLDRSGVTGGKPSGGPMTMSLFVLFSTRSVSGYSSPCLLVMRTCLRPRNPTSQGAASLKEELIYRAQLQSTLTVDPLAPCFPFPTLIPLLQRNYLFDLNSHRRLNPPSPTTPTHHSQCSPSSLSSLWR